MILSKDQISAEFSFLFTGIKQYNKDTSQLRNVQQKHLLKSDVFHPEQPSWEEQKIQPKSPWSSSEDGSFYHSQAEYKVRTQIWGLSSV